jgi:toxin ParE1/3/4
MTFIVQELPKAKLDKDSIFRWLHERSPAGASGWLRAYDSLIDRLREDASACVFAPENQDCDFDVRQALFKTRRGRIYRDLFVIAGDEVFILRVRGPGQASVEPEDLR